MSLEQEWKNFCFSFLCLIRGFGMGRIALAEKNYYLRLGYVKLS
jgi:hypothetical protein